MEQPKIVVFSTPSCSFCVRAKDYLRTKGFRFSDVDVSKDSAALRDMESRSGQTGVPVILIGSQVVKGFDVAKINRLLGIH
jgi:glutaredoxin-like YruB-family protein